MVDKASVELGNITVHLKDIGKAAKSTGEETEKGLSKGAEGVIGLNQGLELARKGFEFLKVAAELPFEAFHKILDVSNDLVREYDKEFLASQKLETALRVTGQATDENRKALAEASDEIERHSRFQDDAAKQGQALALSLGVQARTLPALTRAAADLATVTGVDLTTAFEKLIGGAETGRLSIGRASIEVSQAADKYTRLADVIQYVDRNFRGQAQAAAQGGAGPLIQLQNQIEKVQAAAGQIVAATPQYKAFIQTTKEAAAALIAFGQTNGEVIGDAFGRVFTSTLQIAATAAQLFAKALTGVGLAVQSVIKLLDLLPDSLSPFAKMREEIAKADEQAKALREDFAEAQRQSTLRPETLQAYANDIAAADQRVIDLKDHLKQIQEFSGFDQIGTELDKIGNDLSSLQVPDVATPQGFLQQYVKNLDDARRGVGAFEKANEDAAGAAGGIAKVDFSPVVVRIQEMARDSEKLRAELGFVTQIIDHAGNNGQDAFKQITEALDILRSHGDLTNDEFEALSILLAEIARNAKGLQTTLNSIQSTAMAIGQTKIGIDINPTSPTAPVGETAPRAASGADAGLKVAVDALAGAVKHLDESAGVLGDASGLLGEAGTGLGQAVLDLESVAIDFGGVVVDFDKALSSLPDTLAPFNDAGKALGVVAKDLVIAARRVWQGGHKIATNQEGVPPFELGGVVRQPLVGLIGEKRPEVVLPLDQSGAAFARSVFGGRGGPGGLGESVHVAINVDRLELSEAAADDLAQRFSRRFADRILENARRR